MHAHSPIGLEYSEQTTLEMCKRHWAAQFRDANIPFYQEDLQELLMAVTGFSQTDIVLRGIDVLSRECVETLNQFAIRRLSGEPVDMILGWREFYGRRFSVTKDVLSPRGDSETLITACLSALEGKTSPKILDLGTGSGALALTLLAECKDAKAVAADISPKALHVAKANAQSLGLADRCEFVQSDWFENIAGQYDLIVSNPPYITDEAMDSLEGEVLAYDPDLALRGGRDGLEAYRKILKSYRPFLRGKGSLWVEIGYDQGAEVVSLFKSNGFLSPTCLQDMAGHDRCVGAEH